MKVKKIASHFNTSFSLKSLGGFKEAASDRKRHEGHDFPLWGQFKDNVQRNGFNAV
jgi:hypothetical protein